MFIITSISAMNVVLYSVDFVTAGELENIEHETARHANAPVPIW